jgi:hypothetical protein
MTGSPECAARHLEHAVILPARTRRANSPAASVRRYGSTGTSGKNAVKNWRIPPMFSTRSREASKNKETETLAEAAPQAVPQTISSAAPLAANISSKAQRKTPRPAQSLAERCAAINQLISAPRGNPTNG